MILDYDEAGNLVGSEILGASRRIPDVTRMQFEITVERPGKSGS